MRTDALMAPTAAPQVNTRNLRAVILDLTGTPVGSRFGVTDVLVLSRDSDQEALLQCAASVGAISALPIAKAISESSRQRPSVEGFQSSRSNGAAGGRRANG